MIDVSVIAPVYNEALNLEELHRQVTEALAPTGWSYELLLVDDGSRDGSVELAEKLATDDGRVRSIVFARNFGQTAAMLAGIDHAQGRVLVPIDADLQNDPADIPRMVRKLEEGFDVVSGWRRDRKDAAITRKLPSMIANRIVSWVTGTPLHDYGCSLKAYRAEAVRGVQLFGEMHRFIPAYAGARGARIVELEVNHRPRVHGESKYGLERSIKVIIDLLTLKFLGSYSTKPAYVFGGLGLVLLAAGVATVFGVTAEKLLVDRLLHKESWLLLGTFLSTLGVVLLSQGLLAELVVRVYYDTARRRTYVLREELRPNIVAAGSATADDSGRGGSGAMPNDARTADTVPPAPPSVASPGAP